MRQKFISFILFLSDFLILIFSYYVTSYIRKNLELDFIPFYHDITIKNFLFIIVIINILLIYEHIYKFRYDFWQEMLKIIKAFFFSYILVLSILSLTKLNLEYSRLFITIYFFISFLLIVILKRVIKRILFKNTKNKIKTLILGNLDEIEKFKNELEKNWYIGEEYCKKDFNKVLIISSKLDIKELEKLIYKYLDNKELYITPYLKNINFSNSKILDYTNIRSNAIFVENKLLNKINLYIKRLFDIIFAIFLLPFLLIIHLIISFFIKIDDKKDIFFIQKRVGENGKTFNVYKYRTMNSDEKILKDYFKKYPKEKEFYEKYHKLKNDPRITRVGKFLRKTSLDELPQVINILKGEMSFVGPRPYLLEELNKIGTKKNIIFKVKPGLTGLWQISGRNNLTFEERVQLDEYYIKNWSLWLDIVILLKTIKVVIKKEGAF